MVELMVFSYNLATLFHEYKFKSLAEAKKALGVFKTKRVRCIICTLDGTELLDESYNKGV